MKYVRLTICPIDDPDYCFAGSILHHAIVWLATGDPVRHRYPDNPSSVHVPIEPEMAGIKRPDLLGNTRGLLILSGRAREVFDAAALELGARDTCGFTLINHKGRVHASDYAFVNPHGTYDIAHSTTEYERYRKNGNISGCTRWVLDTAKLEGKPDLLQAQDLPKHYFVSERFMKLVEDENLENFQFNDVEYATGSS